jgi:hypothetical protein
MHHVTVKVAEINLARARFFCRRLNAGLIKMRNQQVQKQME